MITYIVTVLFVLVIYLYMKVSKEKVENDKWRKIPTESGLPIIGVVNHIEKPFCNYLVKLFSKHGPIYQMKFGMRKIVVLNTFEYIKAALIDGGDTYNGRWKAQSYVFGGKDSGLIFVDGKVWDDQRTFVLKTLRDFGIGRPRSMEIVGDECHHLLEDLEQLKGRSFNLSDFISLYTTNVILTFVMNKRFSPGNQELDTFAKFMDVLTNQNDPVSNFALMFPFLENNEWLLEFIIWITRRKALIDKCHAIFEKEIKEHLSRLDFNSEGDDLIDRFLIRQRQMRKESGNFETFTDIQLVRNGVELVFAGYDTTATTIVWCFMFMAMYQDVQTKVHEELVNTIGSERMTTMSDRMSLVYTLAVIDEIYRLSNTAPIAVMHRTLTNGIVKDHFIPKNTIVIINLLASHIDPNVWSKPLEFHPEHFLYTDDHGQLKYKAREELSPFGMGKRNCLGESLARMEIFIFFTSVMQKFHVRMVKEIPHFDVFNTNNGIIRTPKVGDFIFDRRN